MRNKSRAGYSALAPLAAFGAFIALVYGICNAEIKGNQTDRNEKQGIERVVQGEEAGAEKGEPSFEEQMEAVYEIESENNPNAKRYEATINDTSYGLGQILTRVAVNLEAQNQDLPRITDYGNLDKTLDNGEREKAEEDLVRLYGSKVRVGKKTEEVKIDGVEDNASSVLIKRLQRKHRIDVDGKLGNDTWVAIQKERHLQDRLCKSGINKDYTARLYRQGLTFYDEDSSLAVAAYNSGLLTPRNARVEQQLNELYGTGFVTDGRFNDSIDAVKRFQKEYGLKADGVVGPKTYAKLQKVYSGRFPNRENQKGIIPDNKYTPNHVRKFREALENDR